MVRVFIVLLNHDNIILQAMLSENLIQEKNSKHGQHEKVVYFILKVSMQLTESLITAILYAVHIYNVVTNMSLPRKSLYINGRIEHVLVSPKQPL